MPSFRRREPEVSRLLDGNLACRPRRSARRWRGWRNGSACASFIAARAASHFFFQAEDGIRDYKVTGVQTCALPIFGLYLDVAVGVQSNGFDAWNEQGAISRLLGVGAPPDPLEIGRASCRERGCIGVADDGRKESEIRLSSTTSMW